ncbi:DEAD/DEAH box helicase [Hutsoniella sourekii]
MKFNELHIDTNLLKALDDMGFEEPTAIQEEAIPVALEGRDLIGQAQTGTGKTAAFGLPMLDKIDPTSDKIQGLVIAPTRELAIQVQDELYRLSKYKRAKAFVVYGGSPINKQIQRIQRVKPQIIVGTPGRILDLIQRNILGLGRLETLVLDEADEMLNMGFIEDIRAIISQTPTSRQTLLFSATMPKEIERLANEFLKNPAHVKIKAQTMTADLIEQFVIECRDDEKFDVLTRLLDVQNPKQAIVFCRTKKRVDEVGRGLSLRGFDAELIHGDIVQQKRTKVINDFRQGRVELLVATDVAARGLDISGVSHVYNYDIPQDPESYVHRIGRTGRAGQDGQSITFVVPNERAYLKTIEDLTRIAMTPMEIPTVQEAQQGQVQQLIDEMNDLLSQDSVANYRHTAKLLLNHYEPNDLVSALLAHSLDDSRNADVSISPQRPLPQARQSKRESSNNRRHNRGRGGQRNRRGQGQGRRHRSQTNKSGRSSNNDSSKQKSRRSNRRNNQSNKRTNNQFTIKRK